MDTKTAIEILSIVVTLAAGFGVMRTQLAGLITKVARIEVKVDGLPHPNEIATLTNTVGEMRDAMLSNGLLTPRKRSRTPMGGVVPIATDGGDNDG